MTELIQDDGCPSGNNKHKSTLFMHSLESVNHSHSAHSWDTVNCWVKSNLQSKCLKEGFNGSSQQFLNFIFNCSSWKSASTSVASIMPQYNIPCPIWQMSKLFTHSLSQLAWVSSFIDSDDWKLKSVSINMQALLAFIYHSITLVWRQESVFLT